MRQIIGIIAMTIQLSCWGGVALTAQQGTGSALSPVTVPGDEQWDTRFGPPGVAGTVHAVAVHGSDVYIGGNFSAVGALPVRNIARWDGRRWWPLGTGTINGTDGPVMAIAVSGDNVYAGGLFGYAGDVGTSDIAVWNRSSNKWSAMGYGVGNPQNEYVSALALDDSNVYAAGSFTTAGSTITSNIARWNGSQWSRVGGGVNAEVHTLQFAGGSLYAGGNFTSAGGVEAQRVARWNGSAWTALGKGADSTVRILCLSGDLLYVGGDFVKIDGTVKANHVAQYQISTQTWSKMANGFPTHDMIIPSVWGMTMIGSTLYICGNFPSIDLDPPGTIGNLRLNSIYSWNGTSWRALDSVTGNESTAFPNALAADGASLIVVGQFNVVHMLYVGNIARWDGAAWTPFGTAAYSTVDALAAVLKDVYVGSDIGQSDYLNNLNVLKGIGAGIAPWSWDGGGWRPLGGGALKQPASPPGVRTIAASPAGGGLFYGGTFVTAGGSTVNNIARYDGTSWSALGTGVTTGGSVNAIAALSLEEIYVGGAFTTVGGIADSNLAVWNGSANSWSNIGNVNGTVNAIAIDGDNVYIGGRFSSVGGISAMNLAVYNRLTKIWREVGGGVSDTVYALAFGNKTLYVGGALSFAGGVPVGNFAQWTGTAWTNALGGVNSTVRGMAADARAVFLVGDFTLAGGKPANYIAQWNGTGWTTMGSGLNHRARAVLLSGTDVYVGGEFTSAGGVPSYYFGRWNRVAASAPDRETVGRQTALSLHPNPAADQMTLMVRLRSRGGVRIEIYDVLGKQVGEVYKGALAPGEHTFSYRTEGLSNGVYVVRMQSGASFTSRNIMIRH